MAEHDDIERFRRNLQDEVDGAALYAALAEAETDPVRKDLFLQLSEAESSHAKVWREKLAAAGITDIHYLPTLRTRVLARLARRFEFALLHDQFRIRKGAFERARLAPAHQSSAMIKMKMRQDHVRDVAGLHPERAKMIDEPSFAVVENLSLGGRKPIADPGINQDRLAAFYDQGASEIEPDAILLVGRMLALPEFAGHHAEHASAVVPP